MKRIATPLKVISEFRRPFIGVNVAYFALIACGILYTSIDPSFRQRFWQLIEGAFSAGPLSALPAAAGSGQLALLALMIFGFNLLLGSLAVITLPSLVIPFSGLLVGAYRAFLWGMLAPPATGWSVDLVVSSVPFLVLVLLEGEGYVLAMLAAFLHGRAFVFPQSVGASTHRQGYREGVRLTLRLYILVAFILAVAAIYEALLTV